MREMIFLLLLLCCSIKSSSASKNTIKDHIKRGSSLSVEDASHVIIRSPDNTYTCGFYGFQSNAYWFAIWFTNSNDRTVVWTANRNKPVNGRGSKLTFRGNGAMVLTDIDDTVVWETNTLATDVNRAVLLNTGNLVLTNQKGQILWESFDYPTDTLLPSQTLTRRKSLISTSRRGTFQSGHFVLSYNTNNVLILTYDGPEISSVYWPSRDTGFDVWALRRASYNTSRIAVFDDHGAFMSSDWLQFNASDSGALETIKRRLTLDYDGNLRMYSLNGSTGLWLISWQAIAQPCSVIGICGRNGICDTRLLQSVCSCPPAGYRWTDPTDLSQGCKPTFNIKCPSNNSTTKFGLLEVLYTDYYGFDLYNIQDAWLDGCKRICLSDCRCVAFTTTINGPGCYFKTELFGVIRSPNFPGTTYLKVPLAAMETTSQSLTVSVLTGSNATCVVGFPPSISAKNVKLSVFPFAFLIGIGVVEALAIFLGWWIFYKKKRPPNQPGRGVPYRIKSV